MSLINLIKRKFQIFNIILLSEFDSLRGNFFIDFPEIEKKKTNSLIDSIREKRGIQISDHILKQWYHQLIILVGGERVVLV
jgi:hypothetical protein